MKVRQHALAGRGIEDPESHAVLQGDREAGRFLGPFWMRCTSVLVVSHRSDISSPASSDRETAVRRRRANSTVVRRKYWS